MLKGTNTINHYLGCNFFKDKEEVLYFTHKNYIKKIISIFETIFEHKPSNEIHSPLEKGDYPELDTSNFLN